MSDNSVADDFAAALEVYSSGEGGNKRAQDVLASFLLPGGPFDVLTDLRKASETNDHKSLVRLVKVIAQCIRILGRNSAGASASATAGAGTASGTASAGNHSYGNGKQLVRRLISDHSKLFHRTLAAAKPHTLHPVLRLLVEMVEHDGGASAAEVYTMLDPATSKLFHKLLIVKGAPTSNQDSSVSLGKRKREMTPAGGSIARDITIHMISALMQHCPPAQTSELVSLRTVMNDVFKHVATDPDESARRLLDGLSAVLDDKHVSRSVKLSCLNEHHLARLLTLYRDDGGDIRGVLHNFMRRVATDTNYGLLFESDGLRPPPKSAIYNPVVGALLLSLKPVQDPLQQTLLIDALTTTPELIAHYTHNTKLDLVPKLDAGWIKSVNLLRAISRIPLPLQSLDGCPTKALVELGLPAALSRQMTKILSHESELVRLSGMTALKEALDRIALICTHTPDPPVDLIQSRMPDFSLLVNAATVTFTGTEASESGKLLREAAIGCVRRSVEVFDEVAGFDFARLARVLGEDASDSEKIDLVALLPRIPNVVLFGKKAARSVFRATVEYILSEEDRVLARKATISLHAAILANTLLFHIDHPPRTLALLEILRHERDLPAALDFVEDACLRFQAAPFKYLDKLKDPQAASGIVTVLQEQVDHRQHFAPLADRLCRLFVQVGERIDGFKPRSTTGAPRDVEVDDEDWKIVAAFTDAARGQEAVLDGPENHASEEVKALLITRVQQLEQITSQVANVVGKVFGQGDLDSHLLIKLLRHCGPRHLEHLLTDNVMELVLHERNIAVDELVIILGATSSKDVVASSLPHINAAQSSITRTVLQALLDACVRSGAAPTGLNWHDIPSELVELKDELLALALDSPDNSMMLDLIPRDLQHLAAMTQLSKSQPETVASQMRLTHLKAAQVDLSDDRLVNLLHNCRDYLSDGLISEVLTREVVLDGRLKLLAALPSRDPDLRDFHRQLVSKLTRRFAEDRVQEGKQLSPAVLTSLPFISTYVSRSESCFVSDTRALLDAMVSAALENQVRHPVVLQFLEALVRGRENEAFNYSRAVQDLASVKAEDFSDEAISLLRALLTSSPSSATPDLLDVLLLAFTASPIPSDNNIRTCLAAVEQSLGVPAAGRVVSARFDQQDPLANPFHRTPDGKLELQICQARCKAAVLNEVEQNVNPYSVTAAIDLTAMLLTADRESLAGLFESGLVGVCLLGLSDGEVEVRARAAKVLGDVWTACEGATTVAVKSNAEVITFFNVLSESILPISLTDSPLPRLITSFLAAALHVIQSPTHHLFEHVNRFLLARPAFELDDVPMWYALVGETDEHARSFGWLVRMISPALTAQDDAATDIQPFRRRHVLETLMGYAASRLQAGRYPVAAAAASLIDRIPKQGQARQYLDGVGGSPFAKLQDQLARRRKTQIDR
ncbi:hypothetical protein PYCC9005_005485 [Savitreella phatthalungensis]